MTKAPKGEFAVQDRRPGFAIIDNELIDDYGPLLGAYGIAAYCILVRFANRRGTDAYPSYQTVSKLMGASRRSAIRAINNLVSLGLIGKEKRESKGEPQSNMYTILPVRKPQASQVVGSAPQSPPSDTRALPSDTNAPPSDTQAPDQDTNNKTPRSRHPDQDNDDDDAFSSLVKADLHVGFIARGDHAHDATRTALLAAANEQCAATIGNAWDNWPTYRDRLTNDELHLFCYWCKRLACTYEQSDSIHNPAGFVRDGVKSGALPGLIPSDQAAVDSMIDTYIDLVKQGLFAVQEETQ